MTVAIFHILFNYTIHSSDSPSGPSPRHLLLLIWTDILLLPTPAVYIQYCT